MTNFPRVAKLNNAESFQQHLESLPIELSFDKELEHGTNSPLAQSVNSQKHKIGNRFCILPMEGWDGTTDGKPSDLTRRRWQRFGMSGAKLIWGGEAVAVRHDGRANPNQLVINEANLKEIETLREILENEHNSHFGDTSDLSIGLQLTHSGRFARPNDSKKLEPRTIYAHPILDNKFNIDPTSSILSDDELDQLVEDFVAAATGAEKAGFDWVDVKHCHGYLGHEMLSGFDRPGKYGGCFENRTRFLTSIVDGIRANAPKLEIGVRVSIFDFVPFGPDDKNIGQPVTGEHYRYAFGGDQTGTGIELSEPIKFMGLLEQLGIELVCTTAGSPYYNPHIQRPAAFPPSDGYLPPEDPLVGVARQLHVTSQLKAAFPNLVFVGSGYSYLQQWLGHVAQHCVRNDMVDSVGLGRMVLSYPEMPADILAGRESQRKKICRTFSDCTTAPRNGLVSGCYPLDEYYKSIEEFDQLVEIKKSTKR